MLLAAFAAMIAVTLLWQQKRWIGEHEHRRDQVQAQALAMAGVQWARQVLNDNVRAKPYRSSTKLRRINRTIWPVSRR